MTYFIIIHMALLIELKRHYIIAAPSCALDFFKDNLESLKEVCSLGSRPGLHWEMVQLHTLVNLIFYNQYRRPIRP